LLKLKTAGLKTNLRDWSQHQSLIFSFQSSITLPIMKRFSSSLIAILIIALLMGIIALPNSVKSKLPDDPVSTWIKNQNITLGLDLQGGTQLDYRIDLRSIRERNNDDDPSNDVAIPDVIEGVKTTIERRVNALGVSEPQIYTSKIGGEEHIIVELAGIKDIDEAKAVVGKTIQLEFKEPKTEEDPEEVEKIREEANTALQKALQEDSDFNELGQRLQTADGEIEYREEVSNFESDLSDSYREVLPEMEVGSIHPELIEAGGEYMIINNQIQERKGFIILKLLNKERKDKLIETEEEINAQHIVIAFEGAERASEDVVRTKEEAETLAGTVLVEAKADPENFGELAEQYSDGPSATKGGDLGSFSRGRMAKAFEEAAFNLEVGQISEVVETEFGFHIIKLNDKQEAESNTVEQDYFTYSEIFYDTSPDQWQSTGLDGAHFKYASVTYTQIGTPQVTIQFDNEGAELFEDLTERLSGQQLAIFVGGEIISAPTVNEKISGGNAVITGDYTLQEALQLANDLNTGAIDAPIILSGQYTISASLGENALTTSLYAGILGLIALALFMVLYYRMMGVFAVIALLIYSIIIIFILKTTPIVMTLAGIAGIILSVGMAVDANILIFERTREELNEGKSYSGAVTAGFERAWSSIRDSNISSLITCVILWFFGNSIIRGFALMLGIGILISMFTAITVTRSFLHTLNGTRISKNRFLLGARKDK
jgi:protein-export membrane protein SecD